MMHAHMKMALSIVVILFAVCFCPSLTQTNTTTTTTTTTNTTTTTASTTGNSPVTMAPNATNSTTPTTTTTTTMPTTTTTPPPAFDLMHNMQTAKYVLEFTVGPTNTSDIQYVNMAATADSLRMRFQSLFQGTNYSALELMSSAADNKTYSLMVTFLAENVFNSTTFPTNLRNAVTNIVTDNTNFRIPNTNVTDAIVAAFLNSTMDICSAKDICTLGFTCNELGCEHMCRMEDCSGHGMCYVTLTANNTAQTLCNCDDEYDTEYEGHRCQDSRRGRDQIIAILAACLGTACFILLIVVLVMCVLQIRRNSKYNI